MRKQLLFSAVFLLFLLVPASITWAQVTKTLNGTVRYESGMSTSNLSTPNGNVVVKLPQSMSGKMITGTVSAEPAGKTEKEKNKNLKELLKMVVMLGGQKIPLSATPSNFDWLTHSDRNTRTPMELLNVSGAKVAEVSLPTVLSIPSWNSAALPALNSASKIVVKGDALNVYTNQEFSPGQKFVLTDSRGQKFTMSPVCLSSQQAVMNVPGGASPGMCTVSGVFMGIDQISPARFTLVDINLTSPNTNLRPGELSNVLVELNTGMGSSVNYYKDDVIPDLWGVPEQIPIQIRIDLRNLNPNTVTMEGGNLQRVYAATVPETNRENIFSSFQIRRNITGNAVGSFSVSATLHEDYSTSNDPFRPQLNVLKTPEDFNAWSNGLKKDLKGYAEMHDNDLLGQAVKINAQRAIDNIPVCTNPEQLDESKAVAYSLIQPLHVPKGAAISWLSSYEALKAAAKDMDTNADGNSALIDYDVLKNGIEFIKRVGNMLKDAVLQTEAAKVQELIEQVQTTAETKENLQGLKNKTNALTAKAGMKIKTDEEIIIKTGMKDLVMSSYQLPSFARPGEVHPFNDLVAYLEPATKTLFVIPEYRINILSMLNAQPLANGGYHINSMTADRTPVAFDIAVQPTDQMALFKVFTDDNKNVATNGMVLPPFLTEIIPFNIPIPPKDDKQPSPPISNIIPQPFVPFTDKPFLDKFMVDDAANGSTGKLIQDDIKKLTGKMYYSGTENPAGGVRPPLEPMYEVPGNNKGNGIFEQLMEALRRQPDNTNPDGWSWMKWNLGGSDWKGFDIDLAQLTPADMEQFLKPAKKYDKESMKNIEDKLRFKWAIDPVPALPFDKLSEKEQKALIDSLKKIFEKMLDDAYRAGHGDNKNSSGLWTPYYYVQALSPAGKNSSNSLQPFYIIIPKPGQADNKTTNGKMPWEDPGSYYWKLFVPPLHPAVGVDSLPKLAYYPGNTIPEDIYFEVDPRLYKLKKSPPGVDNFLTETRFRFYKDADCENISAAKKSEGCLPHMWYNPQMLQENLDMQYYKSEFFGDNHCKKGKGFCGEMLQVVLIEYIYEDRDCTKFVKIVKRTDFKCQ